MGKCKTCGVDIPRGKRYKTEKYGNLSFCSPECYDIYCKEKTKKKTENVKSPFRQLTDYIQSIYPVEYQNWEFFAKQIQSMNKEYNLSYEEIKAIIRYAMEYANHKLEPEYGLGQFIPKYIQATRTFVDSIIQNSNYEVPEPEVTKVKKKKNTAKIRLEEW